VQPETTAIDRAARPQTMLTMLTQNPPISSELSTLILKKERSSADNAINGLANVQNDSVAHPLRASW
jgi:hypothetical protein